MSLNTTTPLIQIKELGLQLGGNPILQHIHLDIHPAEQWAIVGDSGSGKTSFAHALTGRMFFSGSIQYHFPDTLQPHIELVAQQHHFKNLSNTSTFYYQQRFNASESADSHSVLAELGGLPSNPEWIDLLHLRPLLEKPVLQLSNGENKRLQLARALLSKPDLLILDNPFIGLDNEGRKTLHAIVDSIAEKQIPILLITTPGELPAGITHVAVLEKGSLVWSGKKAQYQSKKNTSAPHAPLLNKELLQQLQNREQETFHTAIRMEKVHIQYGEKIILDQINWEVTRSSRWSVSGPNGAGKSTLLSLITGDNPQAYANRIFLFDKQRGSGESIWDIKKKIGFVSPELHLYFDQSITCKEVIASGLFDTIGLFRSLTGFQEKQVALWLQLLELTAFQHKRIYQLSTGQQRMVLLARALVKNPPLLILDEPCQGLDDHQAQRFKSLINEICAAFDSTLLYVSHYSKDIPDCIQHYLQLKDGKMVH